MSLLDRYFLHPLQTAGSAILHEVGEKTHPLVHAIEGPINNVIHDSEEVVGGLYRATQGVVHMVPYWVGAWLAYTAFQMYFPDEYRTFSRSIGNAAKRMRLT